MGKDVKIEIIYYKTPADVSLEFGLHGDYPVRLLASCANSNKDFLKNLKRAASRSEIIITVGGYLEDNLPLIISRAIGKAPVVPDYQGYGISAHNRYAIPESAVPLSSKNHNFGGFLIESGPQTIISFTEDKETRLRIVKEFLAGYITEHHNVYGSGAAFTYIEENTDINQNNTSEEDIIDFEDSTDSVNEEPIIDDIDKTDSCNNITNDIEIYEVDDMDESVETVEDQTDFNDFDDDFIDIIESKKGIKHHKRGRVFRILCFVFTMLAIIGTALVFFLFKGTNQTAAKPKDYYLALQSAYSDDSITPSEAFDKVKKLDESVFTWLNIDTIGVNHPVNTVNSLDKFYFYLNSLPDGIPDTRGMLFSLSNKEITDADRSTIIFGNANPNGLFNGLNNLKSGDVINAADSHIKSQWQITWCFNHSDANGFDYTQTEFSDTEAYINYLNELKALSGSQSLDEFYGNEKIIVLVGVTDNERYVAVAKLKSIKVLMTPEYFGESTNNPSNTSSDPGSDVTSSDESSSSSDDTPADGDDMDNDFLGDTPDIILPVIPSPTPTPSTPSSSTSTGSTVTSVSSTSSLQSSSTVPSEPSSAESSTSGNSSEQTSAEPSLPSSGTESVSQAHPSSSTVISSSVLSSTISSTVSSTVSSAPSQSKPNVDPLYTWDVTVAVKSKGPDRKGEVIVGSAVEVVAWIIEIEMSPTIHPPEALIAQAIVKYNWIINNGGLCSYDKDGNVILPSKPPENAMQSPTAQALKYAGEAKGMLLMYGNTLAKTYCHDTSAGFTAAYHNVWGGGSYPYLQGVECPVDKDTKNYEVTTIYTADEIKNVLLALKSNKSEFGNIDIENTPKEQWIVPTEYDSNNAYCTKVNICGVVKKGTYLRDSVLTKANTGKTTIRSSAYTVVYSAENDTFTVTTHGYGHGVGLSQQGAIAYAKQGWTAEQILSHFFPGTTLLKN